MNRQNPKCRRVLVIGHYGGSNTGDETMLESILAMLPTSLPVAVVTKGRLPEDIQQQNVTGVTNNVTSVFRAVRAADTVLLGGGTHFHDDYRGLRLLRHYRYMARYVAVFVVAKLLRKRVYYIGIGIGPCSYRATRTLTRWALALADGISVRDGASFREAETLGASSKVVRAFDLTGILGSATNRDAEATNPVYLAVSITDIPGNDGRALSRHKLVETWVAGLRILLVSRPEIHVKIIVVRGGKRESDVEISELLSRSLTEFVGRVTFVPYSPDRGALLNAFRTSYAACVMRYHAGMLAYLAGCRLLLLPYHRKLVDLGHELGLSDLACPSLQQLNAEQLARLLSGLMSSGEEFMPTLPISVAKDMALRNFAFLNT